MPEKDDLGIGKAHFAEANTEEDRERLRDRLSQSKGPSTASSTSRWKTGSDIFRAGGRTPDATKVTIGDLEQMRRDPILAFGLNFIKAYLARANWYIKSTDPRRAAFIDGALRRIYGRFILQYGGCLDFGYQGLVKNFERTEIDWVYLDTAGPGGKELPVWSSSAPPLLWKPFTPLNPRHVSPAWDADGNFAGINYRNANAGKTFDFERGPNDGVIGLDWSLWATNEKDSVFGSLYGWPRLGYSYRFWWAYWYRFGLADRAFEKWADPPVIAYHPTELATDEEGVERNLTLEALGLAEKIRSGANVSLPSGAVESTADGRTLSIRAWELTQMKSETDFTALNDTFEYLDVSRLRALMVPEQAFFEGKGGTSSRNVAATLGGTFENGQALIKAEIDDQINRYIIPQLLEANFGPGGATCEIVTTGFEDQDVETGRAIIQALAQNAPAELAGVDVLELLKRLGIPVLNPQERERAQKEMLDNLQKMKPQPIAPRNGNAGVNASGTYVGFSEEEQREIITLAEGAIDERVSERAEEIRVELSQKIDGDFGLLERLIDRLTSRREKNDPEPELDLSDTSYERETAKIKENAKTKKAKGVHKFVAATWTHPNGHPRCLVCGDEESISPECNREPTAAERKAFDEKLKKEFNASDERERVERAAEERTMSLFERAKDILHLGGERETPSLDLNVNVGVKESEDVTEDSDERDPEVN